MAPLLYLIAFHLQQVSMRAEMKQKLESGYTQTITIDQADAQWIKKGKEISIDGKLFDVSDIQYASDGLIHLSGAFDEKETLLFYLLQQEQDDSEEENSNEELSQLFQLLAIQPGSSDISFIFTAGLKPSLHNTALSSPFKSILTPPPQT